MSEQQEARRTKQQSEQQSTEASIPELKLETNDKNNKKPTTTTNLLKPAKLRFNQKELCNQREPANQEPPDEKPEPEPKTTLKTKQKTTPELKTLARPESKPKPEAIPKQRLKVKTTEVKQNEIKLFLARKKLERESKLKTKSVNTILDEITPSNLNTSATLVPPNNSLQIHAPRVTSNDSAHFSTGLSAELSTTFLGSDEQREHRGEPEVSGLL